MHSERRKVEAGDSDTDTDTDTDTKVERRDTEDTGHDTEEECELLTLDREVDTVAVERQIVWQNVAKFIALNCVALYSLYNLPSLSYQSWAYFLATYIVAAMGITAGAHRLWSHKSYKVSGCLGHLVILTISIISPSP